MSGPHKPQSGGRAASAVLPAASRSARFAECLAVVLRHEGGFVNHPDDPGGATNMGITARTLAEWRGRPVTVDDVRALTRSEAEDIYWTRFWTRLRADSAPLGLDLSVFDFGVNSGPTRATRVLQNVLRVTPSGAIGATTFDAARREGVPLVIRRYTCARLTFLRRLRAWETFGRGWSRRVKDIEAISLALATQTGQT